MENPNPSSDKIHLGPAWNYPLGHILHSLWFYLGLVLLVLPLFGHFLLDPANAEAFASLGRKGASVILGIEIVAVLMIMTVIMNALTNAWVLSYDYTSSPRPLVYLTSGVFNQTIDNVDLSIVVDCDINRTPLDFFFGTGTLSVRTIDGQKYLLHCVSDVFKTRDLILARPPLAPILRSSN